MTCGVHRKRQPDRAGLAAAMPPTPPHDQVRALDTPWTCAVCRKRNPRHFQSRQSRTCPDGPRRINRLRACSGIAALFACLGSLFSTAARYERKGPIPPLDFSQRRHLPHANCEASLGSGCRSLAERLQGGAAAVNVGPRLWTMSTVQSLAPEGAVNRCPSVVRKPTRLSLENPAGGHPQRARQAARRPCGTSWRTCAQPVHRPRFESNASSAPAGEVHLCPTVGRCAHRGMASPTVRTPSVQSRRSVSTSVRASDADNTHEGAMQHDSTQEKQRP